MKRFLTLLFVCFCFSVFVKAANNIKDTTITYCDTIHYEWNGSRQEYYRYKIWYKINESNHKAKIYQISALGISTNNISYIENLIANNHVDPNDVYVEIPEEISVNNVSYTVDTILTFSYFSPQCDIYRGIKIPKTIKYIDLSGAPFTLLKYFAWFDVDAENPYFSSVENCLCDKTGKVLLCYPVCQREDITVPEGFEEVNDVAFCTSLHFSNTTSTVKTIRLASTIKKMPSPTCFCCMNLKSVYIPSMSQWYNIDFTISYCGKPNYDLYAGGELIQNITIPNSMQCVKCAQFMGCNLDTVIIPEGIKVIEQGAFYGSTIKSIHIPTTLDSIKVNSFGENDSLKFIRIKDVVKWSQMFFGDGANPLAYAHNLYLNYNLITQVNLNNNISAYAFWSDTSLVSVHMGSNAKRVGEGAFLACSNLNEVTFNEGVLSIEKRVFESCKQIRNITLPQSLLKIGEDCFSYDSLTTIIIPENVDTIESGFVYNNPVTDIVFHATNPSQYSNGALYDLASLENIYIPCGTYDVYSNIFKSSKHLLREPTFDYSYQVTINNDLGTFAYTHTPDCSDSTLTIEVTPYLWAHFVQWSDGNTDNPRSIKVDHDLTLSAELEYNDVTITLSCDEEKGTVSGAGTYAYNSEITITATPKHGYKFDYWEFNGNTFSKQQTYTFYIVDDIDLVAHFKTENYTVTIQSEDEIKGSAYGSATAIYKSTIEIGAVANYGYHFEKWSDDNTDNPRQYVIEDNITLIAQFAPDTFMVHNYEGEGGYTTGGGAFPYMSEITITAVANEGYDFVYWEDGVTTDVTRTLTVSGEIYLQPYFQSKTYNVTILSEDESKGSVDYSGTNQFKYNQSVTIHAYPNNGYHFARWEDGSMNNPREYTVKGEATLIATFEPDTFIVHDYSGEDGYTTGGGSYPYKAEISVTAYPNYGYDFYSWEDGNTESTRTITVEGNLYLKPLFGAHLYNVTISVNDANMGSVNYIGEYQFYYKDEIELVASPVSEQYEFVGWSDGVIENPRTIIIENDFELTANFRLKGEGIEDVFIDGIAPQKMMIDGVLYIAMPNGILYNSNGQQIR